MYYNTCLRIILRMICSIVVVCVVLTILPSLPAGRQALAANGVNKVINFQGKVTNTNGTNVTNGTYNFVIKIYNGAGSGASTLFTENWTSAALWSSTMSSAPSSGGESLTYSTDTNESSIKVGQILWNTTKEESVIVTSVNTGTNVIGISPTRQAWSGSDTVTNKIYVKDGVFKVAINSLNADLSGVNFNSDSLFVGITFHTDSEMKPRIQYTATPYAMNAEKVNGLTVTNTSDTPFSSTTILKINDGSTVTFGGNFSSGSNALTLATSGSTSLSLPTSGTLATLAGTEELTNKSIGNTGLTFSGATTDITTGTNQDFVLSPNGTGKIGFGLTNPSGYLEVMGKATGKALAIFNETGDQNIFTASASGTTRFVIQNNGNVGINTTDTTGALSIESGSDSPLMVLNVNSAVSSSDIVKLYADSVTSGNGVFMTLGSSGAILPFTGTGINILSNRFLTGGVSSVTDTGTILSITRAHMAALSGRSLNIQGNMATLSSDCTVIDGTCTDSSNILQLNQQFGLATGNVLEIGNSGLGVGLNLVSNSGGKSALIINKTGNTGDIFTASSSGTTRFVVASGGSVGIGVSVPGQTLDIARSADSTIGIRIMNANASLNSGSQLQLGEATSGFKYANITYLGSSFDPGGVLQPNRLLINTLDGATNGIAIVSQATGAPILFSTGGASDTNERMRIDGNGNIGIGTSSPVGKLDLSGKVTGKALAIFNEAGDQDIFTASSSGTTRLSLTYSGGIRLGTNEGTSLQCLLSGGPSAAVFWSACNAGASQWTTNGNDIGYTTGNVGIGTTAPVGKLHVEGRVTGKALGVFNETGNQDLFTASKSGTTKFVIDNGGRVGIGTSNPQTILHISDALPVLRMTNTLTSAGAFNYFYENSTLAGYVGSVGSAYATSDLQNDLVLGSLLGDISFAFDSLTNPKVVFKASGNVGIGTTAPVGLLNVDGKVTGKSLVSLNETGDQAIFTASASGTTKFTISNSGAASMSGMLTFGDGTGTNNVIRTSYGPLNLQYKSGGNAWNNALTIQDVTGNVGIGTTTPNTFKLELAGSIGPSADNTYDLGSDARRWKDLYLGPNTLHIGTSISDEYTMAYNTTQNYLGLNVNGSGNPEFVFDANGSLGIGNTAPVAALNVEKAVTGKALTILNETGDQDIFTASKSGTTIFSISSAGAVIGAQADATAAGFTLLNSAAGTFGSQTQRDAVTGAVVFRGKLFVTVRETDAAGVYRYDGGTTWTLVTNAIGEAASDGSDATNIDNYVMAVWNDSLYIGSQTGANTGALYVSTTADTTTNSFTLVQATRGTFGSGVASIDGVSDLVVYNGSLYLGTQETNLAEVDRYDGGTTLTQVSNTTEGRIGGTNSTTTDAVVFGVWGGRLFAGNLTGSGGNAARLSVYTGVGTTWTDLTGAAGSIGAETNVDDITSLAVWGGALYVATGEPNAATIYRWEPPFISSDTTAANYRKVSFSTSGRIVTGDATNIDSIILRGYRGRLYAGSQTAAGDDTGALYEFSGVPGTWTLINGTRGTFGSQSGVNAVSSMLEMNGTFYIGTDEGTNNVGSFYSWSKTEGNSYALRFDSGANNFGSLTFIDSDQALDAAGRQGSFRFSHSVNLSTGAFDYAEDYPTYDTSLEAGDIVAIDPKYKEYVTRGSKQSSIIGIVSENPGFRLQQKEELKKGETWVPVALVGRVPVKVTTENGAVKAGDYLTLSSIPGVAMKATKAGAVIGRAMEDYNSEGQGKITVFVDTGYFNGENTISGFSGLEIANGLNQESGYAKSLLIQLVQKAGEIDPASLSEVVTDRVVAGLELITPHITTKTINLETITSLTGTVGLTLTKDGKFFIGSSSASAGIVFDGEGNASFSGTVRAKTIEAETIAGLDGLVGDTIARLRFGNASEATVLSVTTAGSLVETSTSIPAGILGSSEVIDSSINASLSARIDELWLNRELLTSLSVEKTATISGSLRVKGSTLLEGVVSVIDYLTANNVLITGVSNFLDTVIFENEVFFRSHVAVSEDTAGYTVIKKGEKGILVTFKRPYEKTPVIDATLLSEPLKDKGATESAELLFESNYQYVVSEQSEEGFVILLNKPAAEDLKFSWTAFGVDHTPRSHSDSLPNRTEYGPPGGEEKD